MNKEEIRPIILTDTETGEKYTLEFTTESVKYAQLKEFSIDDLDKKPLVVLPDLFYYAFRAHHRNISREKVDKIRKEVEPISTAFLERLCQLYYLPYLEMVDDGEEERKNAKVTVEL